MAPKKILIGISDKIEDSLFTGRKTKLIDNKENFLLFFSVFFFGQKNYII